METITAADLSQLRPAALDAVRHAIRESGRPIAQIAAEAGIERPHLQNFLAGTRPIGDETLTHVLSVLGYTLEAKIFCKKLDEGP